MITNIRGGFVIAAQIEVTRGSPLLPATDVRLEQSLGGEWMLALDSARL
jgi:hypothetical protein